MPYIRRNQDNSIFSLYSDPPRGHPLEFLPDSNQEVIDFRDSIGKPSPKQIAPPEFAGNSIAALRNELAVLRQALIDAGIFAP